MELNSNRVERRVGQRFQYQIPIEIRVTDRQHSGFSQDLSAKGVSFYTDVALVEAEAVELTLLMPSEITLGASMKVRCQGSVLRVVPSPDGRNFAVAVRLKSYEYLEEKSRDSVSLHATPLPEAAIADECVSSNTFNFRGASGG